jgi:hypothetical protein
MAGSCEQSNKLSGSINAEISWLAERLLSSQDTLCSKKLGLATPYNLSHDSMCGQFVRVLYDDVSTTEDTESKEV